LLFGGDDGELVPVTLEAAAIVFVAISLGTEIHTVFHDGKKLMKLSETSYIYMTVLPSHDSNVFHVEVKLFNVLEDLNLAQANKKANEQHEPVESSNLDPGFGREIMNRTMRHKNLQNVLGILA
jgi:hypothetical protein